LLKNIALKIREFFHDYNIPAITLQNINVSRKKNGQQEIEIGETRAIEPTKIFPPPYLQMQLQSPKFSAPH